MSFDHTRSPTLVSENPYYIPILAVMSPAEVHNEAFNTPKWITNVGLSNPNLWQGVGFSVNYKHQSPFLWQSSLATGIVPVITNDDAQVSYRINPLKLGVKLGASNLLNQPYNTFVAGPSVGGFYYLT